MPSSSNLFLFVCGLAVGAALVTVLFSGRAEAQRVMGAYTISQHSNPNALAGVFRLNQATGYMSYCYITDAQGKPAVSCTQEVP
ncbi:MAG: hypothetical protein HY053_07480 [Proteobacteria bacterium]|nr:hypothetical protein [Pseudomonadota bacterium]